jgi:hypothetical protein
MERSIRTTAIMLMAAALIFSEGVWAAVSISVTGSWFETIDATDLVGGAGSDLRSTCESAADQVAIDISGAGSKSWAVDIRKVDTDWPSGLGLYARRTSDGSGQGQVTGGTSYQQVSDTYQEFFTGDDNRKGINIQMMIDGVSAEMPCGNFLTTVYYTVTEVR